MPTKDRRIQSIDLIDISAARMQMARDLARRVGARGINRKIVADVMIEHKGGVTLENAQKLTLWVNSRRGQHQANVLF